MLEEVNRTGRPLLHALPQDGGYPGRFPLPERHMYTESKSQGRFRFAQTVGLTREPAFASRCIGCGKCEQHCPRSIPIRQMLKQADRALRPLPYKLGIGITRKYMFRKV